MFIGEALNIIPFLILRARAKSNGTHKEGKKKFNLFWLWLPALCDLTGTSVMYLGLGVRRFDAIGSCQEDGGASGTS
jgi:hypothetical protein